MATPDTPGSSPSVDTGPGGRRRWEAPRWLRTAGLVVLGVLVVGGLALALRPAAVPVDVAVVDRGTVEVAVLEDGRTRLATTHVVRAPVTGTLERVELRPGDHVSTGTELARIRGPEAAVPDARTAAQLQVRLEAARAAVERVRAQAEAVEALLVEAREQVRRQEVLLEVGGGTASALERARAALRSREAEARSAEAAVRVAEREVEDLRLSLARPAEGGGAAVAVPSPLAGTVLRVHRESGGAVAAGEPLLDVGDPGALEVVVDLLSADAVRVRPGAEATLSDWGGPDLAAVVRSVEPSGFTRTSALGIEEQRVNVILDPVGDGHGWSQVGDGFRVEARILLERAPSVLRVPVAALFREGEAWAVFRTNGDRVEVVTVEVGRRSQTQAEVVAGLGEGDRVVVYPSDRVEGGVRYRVRG